jgi:hypothetical protein
MTQGPVPRKDFFRTRGRVGSPISLVFHKEINFIAIYETNVGLKEEGVRRGVAKKGAR